MARFGAKLTISKEVENLAETTERNLRKVILPKVMDRAGPIMKKTMLGLSEFPDSDKTGSKKKMSKNTRYGKDGQDRWSRMKKNVIIKKKTTQHAIMRIVGVSSDAKHVNFDHGDKARTTGRIHKLWWVDGKHEVYAKVNPRIQKHDIPKIVKYKTEGIIERMMLDELRRAANSGAFLK